MPEMSDYVIRMVAHPSTNKVLSTVSPEGKPHSIVCGSLIVLDPETIVVGESYMYRTAKYLETNPNVEFLVWRGKEAFSILAKAVGRETEGEVFEKMEHSLERMNMATVAIWKFKVEEIWDEGITPNVGERLV